MASIALRQVTKTYSRHTGRRLVRQFLADWLRRPSDESFYAVREVSFALGRGECLGVVGPNGAGKSTLLSLVAGLSWPDAGEVAVSGRIVPLLALGSGFHPDLTGAENVRLNAALLGFSRRRTREVFDQIVEFSGIGDFIDEPLRTYSSGMVMRLAFAACIHADPEILLIDEVLAVGDQSFQAKCIEKIFELKHAGSVLVCVSHELNVLDRLSDQALWLEAGQVVRQGAASEVLGAYRANAGGEPPSGSSS